MCPNYPKLLEATEPRGDLGCLWSCDLPLNCFLIPRADVVLPRGTPRVIWKNLRTDHMALLVVRRSVLQTLRFRVPHEELQLHQLFHI